MRAEASYDAVVVGAGPNGLAAGITIAREGYRVIVVEGKDTIGGGTRTSELTLPGFWHDVCSAVHPTGVASPFFRSLPLEKYGLEWLHPDIPLAHTLDDGGAVILDRSVEVTAEGLGADAVSYRKLMLPLVSDWGKLCSEVMGPLRIPRHPWSLARFGLRALRSTRGLAGSRFRGERARALIAGMGAHSILPLEARGSAAVGLVMCITGHAVGWPLARGGSQRIAEALAAYLRSLGGEIVTGEYVESIDDLPEARAVLLDMTPRQFAAMAPRLQAKLRRKLLQYRYGPGVFKVDWALDGAIPWKAPECGGAGTVHVGGTLEEVSASEAAVWRGEHPTRPFVLVAQQSVVDQSRAPAGKHTALGYCHVPNGSSVDMTDRIEAQVERFAPGFRDRILARWSMSAVDMERYNPNYVGGDIAGGVHDLKHLFAHLPLGRSPYSTPLRDVYLCSASTPPGAGVHGMCGYHAARVALRQVL